jgi:hypothetical protein
MYCVCQIAGKPGSSSATKALPGDAGRAGPLWKQALRIGGYTAGDSLTFTLYGKLGGSVGEGRNRVLGEASLEGQAFRERGFEGELPLRQAPRSPRSQASDEGDGDGALLRVKVFPPGAEPGGFAPGEPNDAVAKCRFDWKIPGASLVAAERGKALESQNFALGEVPCVFRLRYFPQGFSGSSEGNCALYMMSDMPLEIQVRLTINDEAKSLGPECWDGWKWRGFHSFCRAPPEGTDVAIAVEFLGATANGEHYTPPQSPVARWTLPLSLQLTSTSLAPTAFSSPASRTPTGPLLAASPEKGRTTTDDAMRQAAEAGMPPGPSTPERGNRAGDGQDVTPRTLPVERDTPARDVKALRTEAAQRTEPLGDRESPANDAIDSPNTGVRYNVSNDDDMTRSIASSNTSTSSASTEEAGVLHEVIWHEDPDAPVAGTFVDEPVPLTSVPAIPAESEINLELNAQSMDVEVEFPVPEEGVSPGPNRTPAAIPTSQQSNSPRSTSISTGTDFHL